MVIKCNVILSPTVVVIVCHEIPSFVAVSLLKFDVCCPNAASNCSAVANPLTCCVLLPIHRRPTLQYTGRLSKLSAGNYVFRCCFSEHMDQQNGAIQNQDHPFTVAITLSTVNQIS